jgi:hypothetical protein
MALQGTLSEGRELFVENNGDQTQITLQSGDAGQMQRQGTGFTTGEWQTAPVLYKSSQGAVLQIEAKQGRFYFLIASTSIRTLQDAPSLHDAESIPLHEATAPQLKPMEPLKPLEPMGPMKPMEMKMGDMKMKMGEAKENMSGQSAASQRHFCTQCGTEAQIADNFCARCGQKLRA